MDIENKEGVDLKSLVGEHVLDAVDESTEKVKRWGDNFEVSNVIRFRLDGKVYTAVENPDDGYRSSMEKIFVSDDEMKNVFPPQRVLGIHRTKGEYSDVDDVLELRDIVTGGLVLEVGTSNVEDYYPCFVGRFDPKAMAVNRG